ncbi:unnamed protein product [Clonostachys byssicola]|uniref:RRM domain-containing protein n=1 Tax=Clonostachys byssicola TaxID=160290 RepID=A0A9N9U5A9_9HYPO|nr:unnamed protein product [Clonostachys byssicola]
MSRSNQATQQNQGPNYDPEFESRIGVYRRRQRLLVARSIHFRASRADFETACRAKLSNPDSVQFFWQDANHVGHTNHRGWVMLGFDTRENCRLAQRELVNFRVRNRNVNISVASKRAFAPADQSSQESSLAQAAAPANPGVAPPPPTTTTTTTRTATTTTAAASVEETSTAPAADIMAALLESLDRPSAPQ